MPFRISCRPTAALAIWIGGALLLAHPGIGHSESWNTPYDSLFEQSGAEVTTSTLEDGTEMRRLMTPGDVEVTQYRKGEKVRTVATDKSGLGAVRCVWGFYIEIKMSLDACSNLENPEVSERLGVAINRINKFISKNWFDQISIEQLEDSIENRVIKFHEHNNVSSGTGLQCQNRDIQHIINLIEELPDGEFERGIDKLLSVPRLPVSNPCL